MLSGLGQPLESRLLVHRAQAQCSSLQVVVVVMVVESSQGEGRLQASQRDRDPEHQGLICYMPSSFC
jgi:hypothetical protein